MKAHGNLEVGENGKGRKRLSVVIPGYMTSDSVWRRCVESVLCNIGYNDEVICVDDASPKVPNELEDLAHSDTRISVVRLAENHGQAFARNIGLELSRGRYVAFVDSDDEVRLGTYSRAISALEKNNADIVVYGVRTIWTKNGLCKEDITAEKFIGELDARELKRLYSENLLNYAWNKVYRKDFLVAARIRFLERCIPREDEVFNLECAMAKARWTVISHIGQIYYREDGTALSRYKRYNDECNRTVNETWRHCKACLTDGQTILIGMGEMTARRLLMSNWSNMWRRGTPFSLKERLQWLRCHKEVGGFLTLIKTVLFFVARKYVYVRPIRRWHIKRMFGNIREVTDSDFLR